MKQRQELWDELEKQKALLHEQEQQVYQQLSKLVDAVLAGQITQWMEVEDLLFELIGFYDYDYDCAWELRQKLGRYVNQKFSTYVEKERPIVRLLIDDKTETKEEKAIPADVLYAELGITQEAMDEIGEVDIE